MMDLFRTHLNSEHCGNAQTASFRVVVSGVGLVTIGNKALLCSAAIINHEDGTHLFLLAVDTGDQTLGCI